MDTSAFERLQPSFFLLVIYSPQDSTCTLIQSKSVCPPTFWHIATPLYIYIYIYIHTHTHTHTHIYIYKLRVYMNLCMCEMMIIIVIIITKISIIRVA